MIFDTLLGSGADYQPTPKLALSWKPDASGKIWTVHLRKGVRWSDGAPFTAADVVWTFEALTDPATGSPYNGQYTFIKRVVALDKFTVRFHLDSPNATFVGNALQSQWIMPEHAFRGIPHAQIKNSAFGEHPIGTGAYVLERWNHDQEAVFGTNRYWWDGTPRVRTIDIRIVLQDQGRTDAMVGGAGDLDDGIGADAAQRLRNVPGIREIDIPDLYTRFIYVNIRTPGLNDVVVRRAMMYGWDREAVAAGLRHHDATVANGVEPEAIRYWHDNRVKPYPYDSARANAMLDGAGWKRGPDGVRAKNGVRLAFELLIPNSLLSNDVAAGFNADMRDIGIAVSVHLLDYATFIQQQNASKFQLSYSGWGGQPDPDMLTLLDSKQFPPIGNNVGFYRNPAVDRDLEAGLVTLDPARRKQFYDDMQVRTARDVPMLFATNEFAITAYRDRVHITGPILPGLYLFTNIAHWRLDP
ncbi:MAG: extracellular solute-binding protein family 5 [Candidatus Eremiobacteraeota bacterium]|nr:extracellular solute-binding protein family 5 [Candidatus Eremiobacteraeota bacterium]